MITKLSLKHEIDRLDSVTSNLVEFALNQQRINSRFDEVSSQLESINSRINSDFDKLWKFVQNLDSVEHELDSKLNMLECKTDFLDHNKDALNMWIECLRQTQQLYEDSQKAEVTE